MFRSKKREALSRQQEALVRAVVRDELARALHENSAIRYLVLQGARAEAWAMWGRLADTENNGMDPAASRLCHFCPFSATPAEVALHEAGEHGLFGPLPT